MPGVGGPSNIFFALPSPPGTYFSGPPGVEAVAQAQAVSLQLLLRLCLQRLQDLQRVGEEALHQLCTESGCEAPSKNLMATLPHAMTADFVGKIIIAYISCSRVTAVPLLGVRWKRRSLSCFDRHCSAEFKGQFIAATRGGASLGCAVISAASSLAGSSPMEEAGT